MRSTSTQHPFCRTLLAKTISTSMLFTASVAIAQDEDSQQPASRGEIEVLQVTAQKRVENIQDVPISISAFSAENIKRIGAQNIDDLGNIVPGFETNNNSKTQPKYDIRGIKTNDFGVGADPAVAIYVDGVYAGRSGAALVNFNDVERVEVLKGPQGTLFGRNAAAGAVHIISKRPVEGTEGEYEIGLGSHGLKEFEGLYNTTLADNVYFRGSISLSDEDGYIDARLYSDPITDPDGEGYEMIKFGKSTNQTVRASILWEATDDTDVMFRAEFNEISGDSRPTYSFNPKLYLESDQLDPYGVHEMDFRGNEDRHLFGTSMEINSRLGWADFTSITAYKRFETENHTDDDGSANIRAYFASNNIEQQKQFSQEFRLSGETQGGTRWTVGATYMNEDIYQDTFAEFMVESLDSYAINDALKTAGLPPTGAPEMGIPGTTDVPPGTGLTGFLLQLIPDDLAYLSSLTGQAPADIASAIAQDNLGKPWIEETEDWGDYTSYAAFADVTYPVTDKLDFTLGVRWTRDEKDFNILSYYQNEITIPIPQVPGSLFGLAFADQIVLRDANGDPVLDNNGDFQPTEQSNTWTKVTPRFVLDYQWTNNVMTYITYAEGFKAGGFNTLGMADPFAQEEVDNIEVGLKSTLLDNKLKLNLSAFDYDYTNLQILRLTGSNGNIPVYNVRNVDAAGKGFELESTWAATENLNININYAYLDTEYTRYSLFEGETAADDQTGQPLSGVPKNRFFLGADYFIPADSGEFMLHIDWTSVDERNGAADNGNLGLLPFNPGDIEGLTALNRIDGYDLINARISYISDSDWKVSLYARNLTDENYMISSPGGQGENTGSPNATRGKPRTWGVEFSQSF
ncbi:TonB-dependent receptor [Neptunicella sp. SCSIO 80796]|uniref:TonB-dependent receptor n=1 Tax=Neptunicella plasticusilytica TaxID=3117012 RepID=UPI003A4E55FB